MPPPPDDRMRANAPASSSVIAPCRARISGRRRIWPTPDPSSLSDRFLRIASASRRMRPLIVDDVCGLFALGPAAPWDGRLCTNAQGASFRMVDVKGICLSHEITQLTKPERSRIEVGGDIGKLLSHRAERYPTILTLYLFYYFIEDRRCVGKRLEGLGGQGRILNCYWWTSKQILRVHEVAAGLPKALRRLLFAEAEDIDALFPDARSEPREIAVGRDEAKPIETATMQKVHSVDHQCDVGRILAGRIRKLLLRENSMCR